MSHGRSLRVAIVAPPFYELPPRGYGGTELICHLLAEGLAKRGHDVTLIGAGRCQTPARFVPTFAEPQPEGSTAAPRVELLHAARAAAAIEGLDVDVVHDHTRLGPLTAASRSTPTVVTVHAAVTGPDSAVIELEAVQRWIHPVAISTAQRLSAPQLDWEATVSNGIAVERYAFRRDKEDFVLYLGRISRHKGVHLAIEAARAAGRRLVLAGTWTVPEERSYFEERIRPVLGQGVEWVGEVGFERKVDLLGRAACLLFPAQWHEPFGLAVIEAMACGTPVVALRIGALPELIADQDTGVICDAPSDLPSAIDRAVRLDPHGCRAHVIAHFAAARMAAGYEAVYRRLAAPGETAQSHGAG
jgi:glycosyltransferase involved in cell wall biosynthesis